MLSDQAMPRRQQAKTTQPRLTDEELQRRQHEAEARVRRAELQAQDELMRLEWLRSEARAWHGYTTPPEDGC